MQSNATDAMRPRAKIHPKAQSKAGGESLCSLLGLAQESLRDRRLRLRLTWDAPWQTAVSALDRYPRLRPRDAIRGSGLRLLPVVQRGLPAQVDLIDLDLVLTGGEGLQGTGWLTLCFREPLWIEHLLRELPLRLEARGEAEGLGTLCPGDRGPAAARGGAA